MNTQEKCCPFCGEAVAAAETVCPHCEKPLNRLPNKESNSIGNAFLIIIGSYISLPCIILGFKYQALEFLLFFVVAFPIVKALFFVSLIDGVKQLREPLQKAMIVRLICKFALYPAAIISINTFFGPPFFIAAVAIYLLSKGCLGVKMITTNAGILRKSGYVLLAQIPLLPMLLACFLSYSDMFEEIWFVLSVIGTYIGLGILYYYTLYRVLSNPKPSKKEKTSCDKK